jgi:hypothetical protein
MYVGFRKPAGIHFGATRYRHRVAANISRRGATVLKTADELRHDIASEERFIIKQREKMDRMRSLEAGVRSGDISTNLAMFEISIENAEARISVMETQLRNMKHG